MHNHVGDNSSFSTAVGTSYTSTLTKEALDALHNQSAYLWSSPDASHHARMKQSEHIVAGAQSLDIDLPADLAEKMTMRFDGMKPLDRLLEEPDTRLVKLSVTEVASDIPQKNDCICQSACSCCEENLIDAVGGHVAPMMFNDGYDATS
jgi:hypothetical protein